MRIAGFFWQNHLQDNSHRKLPRKPSCLVILLLFILSTTLSSGLPNFAAANQKLQATQLPVIVLPHSIGNFFVLASNFPFEVQKAEPEVSWLDVETISGSQTAHRVVAITGNPQGLFEGTYYSAIRVNITTSTGSDFILIPVALRVGIEFEKDLSQALRLEEIIPEQFIRLQPDDIDIDVRFRLTPAGHYIFEIIDGANEKLRLRQLSKLDLQQPMQPLSPSDTETYTITDPSEMYAVVFPWMCLEYPCGRSTEDDIADVAPNLDAVNAVSYERYTMGGGQWGIYNVGDPGPWATQARLATWPMVTGGYQPSPESIQAMWNNRAAIANQMISEADANGYQGFCVDVEGHADAPTQNTFINLMDFLADRLHAYGYKLMVVHATWSTIAPIEDLAATSVDYVATMDPYTSLWYDYIPADYHAIEHDRLIWGFTWDGVAAETQTQMWQWMAQNGYNNGVAGAAAWRTPLMPPHLENNIDYYDGFRDYYPAADDTISLPPGDNVASFAIDWRASSVYSDYSQSWGGQKAYDGIVAVDSKWTSDGAVAQSWLALDLGQVYQISGFVVRHAGAAGEEDYYNTLAYQLEFGASLSGPWTELASVENSARDDVSVTLLDDPVTTRFARLLISDAGVDDYARIPEFEVYGQSPAIPSLTGGFPKGSFGSGIQTNEVTEPGYWRWSERFYGHIGIDTITEQLDGCGAPHTYAIGLDQNDLIEYLMKFGGNHSRLVLRGIADRPAPVDFEIFVDSELKAAGSWDNNNDCNQDLAVDIAGIAYGDHAIAVKFVNDYYNPGAGEDRNFYLDGLHVEESAQPGIPSITGGEPKGAFGSGEQTDAVTDVDTWRWSEQFYGHQGIDQITWQTDGCGEDHNYIIGLDQNDLIEYLMNFGGQYPWLILRGIADRPGPVEFDVYIDGQYAASGAWDGNSDCNQEVGVEIPDIPYGTHAIALQFTNDYYDPASGQDRNFYLDGLKVVSQWDPAITWAYPIGTADTAEGWYVSNPLGNSWYSSENQRWYRGHLGEDWFKTVGSSYGEPVYAAAAGQVITVLNNCGNYVDVVIIEHQMPQFSEPIYSFYGHLEADGYVQQGDWVEKRGQIGILGDPITFLPHLHFEIKNRTALVNPPLSTCSDIANGIYISAGYSGISNDYDGGDYYDPSDGIVGNRYYHPRRFIENY